MSEVSVGARQETPHGRVPLATLAVLGASLVVFFNGVDVYLIEDGNPLARLAYRAAPALNTSFAAIYTTALGVGVLAIVAAGRFVVARWGMTSMSHAAPLVALVVAVAALAGLWGLAIRHPVTFVLLVAGLAAFVTVALVMGRAIVTWWSHGAATGSAAEGVLAVCAAAVLGMSVNVAVSIAHTVIMRIAASALYASTIVRIAGVASGELAIASALAAVCTVVAAVMVARAIPVRRAVPG